MARRPNDVTVQRRHAELNPQNLPIAIEKLERRKMSIVELPAPTEQNIDSLAATIATKVNATYREIYGADTVEAHESEIQAGNFHIPMAPIPWPDRFQYFESVRRKVIAGIDTTIDLLKEKLVDSQRSSPSTQMTEGVRRPIREEAIFVVHGHDSGAKNEVARFVTAAGLTPIILHEQASGGRTVIEKLEHYSNVGFAVVLLTPDDEGGPAGGEQQPRARQNVIAELFYFIGKLGRGQVFALKKGDIEIPSDIGGVVYTEFDVRGAWKTELLKELKETGYSLDWQKALGG